MLEAISASTTVLPVRFGTLMRDDETVRADLLAANGERLTALLTDLAGRVQVAVKGTYVEDALLRGVVAGSPKVAALRRRLSTLPPEAGYYERIQLGEMVAAEVARVREQDAALALSRLAPHAVDSRVEETGAADAAFSLAFLVDRSRMDEFSAVVTALIGELGDRISVRYIGPLPPYSFADAELAAGVA